MEAAVGEVKEASLDDETLHSGDRERKERVTSLSLFLFLISLPADADCTAVAVNSLRQHD